MGSAPRAQALQAEASFAMESSQESMGTLHQRLEECRKQVQDAMTTECAEDQFPIQDMRPTSSTHSGPASGVACRTLHDWIDAELASLRRVTGACPDGFLAK